MKKTLTLILSLILFIFMFACNNNHEYKGIVTNKETENVCKTILIYDPILKVNMPHAIIDKGYILIVKDSLNNENKYIVGKKIYNKTNIGDKYFK